MARPAMNVISSTEFTKKMLQGPSSLPSKEMAVTLTDQDFENLQFYVKYPPLL